MKQPKLSKKSKHVIWLRLAALICVVIGLTLPTASNAGAESRYGGNGYCHFKVSTAGRVVSSQGVGVTQAYTTVQDWNGGCGLLNAGLKYLQGGSIKTVYYGADYSNRIDLIRNGQHEQGKGYGHDPERNVGVWTAWFG